MSDEAIEIFGGARRLRAAPGGGGHEGRGGVPQDGISPATFYAWKKKCGGLMPSEIKRLRQLEEENGRLKRILG